VVSSRIPVNGDTVTISSDKRLDSATEVAQPPDRPDYLAGALLQSLMRPMVERSAPSLIGTAFLAIVSFGIIPLFTLPRKLRSFAARERDQLWHFAQWMRGQFGAEADSLDPRTPALDQVVHVLRLVSWGCAAIALGSIFWYLLNGAESDDLMRVGYGYFRHQRFLYSAWDESFFPLWMTSLCVGYGAHWIAVQVHQTRVRRFVESFNQLAREQSLGPLTAPPEVFGFRPMWIVGAVVFGWNGVLWGIPLMLAGAAQTRYIRERSRWTRQDLAQRVRDVLRETAPTVMMPTPVLLRRKCPVAICQAPLPQTATFCPRCGTRVAAVDRVA